MILKEYFGYTESKLDQKYSMFGQTITSLQACQANDHVLNELHDDYSV